MKTRIARISTKTRIALILLWLLAVPVWGTDRYVKVGGLSSGEALDWTTAWSLGGIVWANVDPGDTIYLAGGTYSTTIQPTTSGNSGAYIYVKRATVADHGTDTGWSSSFDATVNNILTGGCPLYVSSGYGSYMVWDGVVAGGIVFKHGDVAGNSDASRAINLKGGQHHIVFANMEIMGPYPNEAQAVSDCSAINAVTCNTITWTNCWIHSSPTLAFIDYSTDLTFDHCSLSNSIAGGAAHANVFFMVQATGLTVRYCDISRNAVETFIIGGHTGAFYVYGNTFRDPYYTSYYYAGRLFEPRLYLNADGFKHGPLYFYNNTIIGFNETASSTGLFYYPDGPLFNANSELRNNIVLDSYNFSLQGGGTSQYNYFDHSTGETGSIDGSSHSPSDLFVNYAARNLRLQTNSGATWPNTNGVALDAAYATDPDGTDRTGLWSMGAYEVGGTPSPPPPTDPVLLLTPGTMTLPPGLPGTLSVSNFVVANVGSGVLTGYVNILAGDEYLDVSASYYEVAVGYPSNIYVTNLYGPTGTNGGSVQFLGPDGTGVGGVYARAIGVLGERFDADEGVIYPPLVISNSLFLLPQRNNPGGSEQTNFVNGGAAWFYFNLTNTGDYRLRAVFGTPYQDGSDNSVWLNMNALPDTNAHVWDMPAAAGLQTNFVTCRSPAGDYTNNVWSPMVWTNLQAGTNFLLVIGREKDAQMLSFELVRTNYGVSGVAAYIVEHPADRNVQAGAEVILNSIASGDDDPILYQWRKNGEDIEGSTDSVLEFASVVLDDAGTYAVGVTNDTGGELSRPAVLSVYTPPAVDPPTFVLQPSSALVAVDADYWLESGATGTAPLAYQWRYNGEEVVGETSHGYVLSSVTTNESGSYTVVVTNAAGSVTSEVAVLTVGEVPYLIADLTPTNQSVIVSSNFTFTVEAGGYAPLAYLWYWNGVYGQTMQGSNVTKSAYPGYAGTYTVVVTNALGSVTSRTATLDVIYPPLTNYSVPPLLRILSQ